MEFCIHGKNSWGCVSAESPNSFFFVSARPLFKDGGFYSLGLRHKPSYHPGVPKEEV